MGRIRSAAARICSKVDFSIRHVCPRCSGAARLCGSARNCRRRRRSRRSREFGRIVGAVRRNQHVIQVVEGVIRREAARSRIRPAPRREFSRFERAKQRGFINDRAAPDVDHHGRCFHRSDLGGADHAARFGRQRALTATKSAAASTAVRFPVSCRRTVRIRMPKACARSAIARPIPHTRRSRASGRRVPDAGTGSQRRARLVSKDARAGRNRNRSSRRRSIHPGRSANTPRPLVNGTGLATISGESTRSTPAPGVMYPPNARGHAETSQETARDRENRRSAERRPPAPEASAARDPR